MITHDMCAELLRAKANLRISVLPKEQLIGLAALAQANGVRLDIKGQLGREQLLEIANDGGKHVTFDVSDTN
jgi:hypothetical protein